jgi:hypothetical protein
MLVTREFKAVAQAGPLWRKVNARVRFKQSVIDHLKT